jgi:TRAP-type uncharacterized transport system fused permease subunit
MFIFNTQLLMIGIANWFQLVAVIFAAVVAMLAFAAGTQGYFLTKEPHLGNSRIAAGGLYPVPAGFLLGYDLCPPD